jgi:hypothetical protein
MKSIVLSVFLLFSVFALMHAQSADSTKLNFNSDSTKTAPKTDSVRQVDFIDYLSKWFKPKSNDSTRKNKKIQFSLFPSASSTGKTSITSFNASFLLGPAKNTTASAVYFYPYISFGDEYGIEVQPYLFSSGNKWHFNGEYFWLNYPQNTWGLGGNTPDSNETLFKSKHLRIYQNSYKSLWTNFYAGVGYALDNYYDMSVESSDLDTLSFYLPYNVSQTISSGITFSLLYDSRLNPINAKQGFYASATFSQYLEVLGSTYEWQSLFLDARKYFPLFKAKPKYHTLAFRSYYWTVISGQVPYFDLPADRWEPAHGESSRGIQQDRYKSNAMMYFGTEYRFGITANGFIGGVVFGSVTSASQYDTQNFMYWHPAGGAGVRMKFNKYSDTNIALDFAASKGFFTVYLFIGEAF